jgi:hypothetical protein
MPGSSYRLLQEVLVRLSCSNDLDLQPLQAAAAALYTGQGAEDDLSRAGTGKGAGTPVPSLLQQRAVPELGPLGEFLLGKWNEQVAHERALLARMHIDR